MAADTHSKAVNGNYGAHQLYGQAEPFQLSQSSNASTGTAVASTYGDETTSAPTATPSESAAAPEVSKPPSKDEVGWYFVESYYTTLSKQPETLHLYYNKRSQFVSGVEAAKVEVSVGQRAIQDRIKGLDYQDCKVRVSNVDSQESGKNIVVQVIGEISNKAAAHRKFIQAFVLAEQPKGYFVLNDIFRYLDENEDEEMDNGEAANHENASALVTEPEPDPKPATLTSSDDPSQQEHDAEKIDKKLEEEVLRNTTSGNEVASDSASADQNTGGDAVEVSHAEDAPVAAIKETEKTGEAPEQAAEAVAKEAEQVQSEKPRDPDPTPVASPVKPAKEAPVEDPVPTATPKPAAPKTWANLVAANRIAAPAVPNGAPSTSSATPPTSQTKAAAPSTNQSVTPPTTARESSPVKGQQNGNTGWQMAGSDNNKKQGRQHGSSSSMSGNQEVFLGYVKNVTEKVDASILKSTLSQYGKLLYFDVSRPKNCAFVEFADSAAYNAAVAANPHSIGGEQIYVEERRPRANAYGGNYAQRGGMRGGRGGNEGRGGYPKDGGRGGYVPRGRGGNMTSRGRGQPQAA